MYCWLQLSVTQAAHASPFGHTSAQWKKMHWLRSPSAGEEAAQACTWHCSCFTGSSLSCTQLTVSAQVEVDAVLVLGNA